MIRSFVNRLAGLFLLAGVVAVPATADWVAEEDHRVRYPQPSDEAGGYRLMVSTGDPSPHRQGREVFDVEVPNFVSGIIASGTQVQIDTVICEPQGGSNPSHPTRYWYVVTPGDSTTVHAFYVKVEDSGYYNYRCRERPLGWDCDLKKFGSEWWYTWWDLTGYSPLTGPFRFSFDHLNHPTWSDWVTSASSSNPLTDVLDASSNHLSDPDGYGYRVHVPEDCCVKRGDLTHDGVVNVSDLTFMVTYMFRGGATLVCPTEADINFDGLIIVNDLTWFSGYFFKGKPAPFPCP